LSFNKAEKEMFKKILDSLNLNYRIEQNKNFVISGWLNQYRFFRTFLSKDIIPFKIHKNRRKKAVKGFLEHSFTKTMIKYLSPLKERNNIQTRELSRLLGIRKDSVIDTTKKERYNKFIRFKKQGKSFIFNITEKGEEFLENIEKLRRIEMENKLPLKNIKRKILVKKGMETSPNHGCRPEERSVEELIQLGIVNLNKPSGPTSHQVSDYVKKILNIPKAGHSGTLE